jgi:hypothetical protein
MSLNIKVVLAVLLFCLTVFSLRVFFESVVVGGAFKIVVSTIGALSFVFLSIMFLLNIRK